MDKWEIIVVAGFMGLASGFLIGSEERPVPLDSELATAQVLTGDKNVRLIGYQCEYRDDHGINMVTIVAREEDFGMDCREIRTLRDDVSFPMPS